jgi:hypothetical protein
MDCRRKQPSLSPKSATKPTLNQQLSALPTMDRKTLQALWEKLFGKAPSPSLRREILIPILSYRIQEKESGGLSRSSEKRLLALAEMDRNERNESRLLHPKPGTRFVREWQDKLHEVSVLPAGYEYNGQTYSSLSEIARLITGTRWSGPAFFGLRSRKKEPAL